MKKLYLIMIKKKNLFKIIINFIFLLFNFIILFYTHRMIYLKKKRIKIGIVGVKHSVNIGNNLIKYAISLILKNLGFIPYIIGTKIPNYNIKFVEKNTNLVIIKKNFNEIKEKDYDILMVNSDQTWRKFDKHFYDYGFLRFAKNWNKKKFIYGASGIEYWNFGKKEIKIIKNLLKNFTGISVREKGSVNLVEKYLNITPEVVIDPTLLIDKKYYLYLIKDYPNNNYNNDYIFIYSFSSYKNFSAMKNFVNKASKILNYDIYEYPYNNESIVEDFIYNISNSKAVVTSTFHGTLLSIIFNKPFITFTLNNKGKERLNSLGKLLSVENRFFTKNEKPDVNLLTTPLNVNYSIIKELRNKSINFIKKSLGLL